ncbi:MAG: ChrR family anti-sigma-E factor [Caulobacteraceae bacterium]
MNPQRHPSEAVLVDYASGALRPAFAAVAAAHLEACAECRIHVRLMERVGGELLGDLPPAAMSDDTLAHALARIERSEPEAYTQALPLMERLAFRKKQWVAPGMWIAKADMGPDLLYLLRLPAGLPTMPHGHHGIEHTAILQGGYTDELGHVGVGDFAETSDEVEHQPRVDPDGPCICLIASERPMRMFNWVGHVVQRLTGV